MLLKQPAFKSSVVLLKCGQIHPFYIVPVHSAVCMAIDNGGHLCTNTLHILISAWLDASQRSGVSLNKSAME